MNLRCVKYEPAHLISILEDPSQKETAKYVKHSDAQALSTHEYAYSVLKDGIPVACAGLLKYWNGRYEAWAFLIPGHRDAFLFIHNKVKLFLSETSIRRIEATVDMKFRAGHRWAKALGFEVECEILKAYGPTGNDFKLYVFHSEKGGVT